MMENINHDQTAVNIIQLEKYTSTKTISENDENANATGLFFLPEEIQELILNRLEVKDLVSCAKVSKSWRRGINNSLVWKKWCLINSYKSELLEKSPTHLFVEYSHIDDESVCMGHWRKVYGWHEKLKMNWKIKRFNRYHLTSNSINVYCFDTDGAVAVTGHEDSSVTVWSISSVPHVIGTFQGVLNSIPVHSIRVDKDIIVLVQKRLLQVFHYSDKVYRLTDLKCFEMAETSIEYYGNYVEHQSQFTSWYHECLRARDTPLNCGPLVYNIFDKCLFASGHQADVVRIWTLPSSEVYICCSINQLVTQIEVDEAHVYFVTRDLVTHLLKYCPETQTPTLLLSVPGKKKLIIGEDLVIALPSPGDMTLKRIWAYRKDDYTQPIGTRTVTGFSNVSLGSSRLIIYSEDSLITVWDPLNNKTLSQFNTGSVVSYLKPSFSSLLLVFMGSALYLWDWKKEECLYSVYNGMEWSGNYGNLLWTNASTILSGGVNNQLEMVSFI